MLEYHPSELYVRTGYIHWKCSVQVQSKRRVFFYSEVQIMINRMVNS